MVISIVFYVVAAKPKKFRGHTRMAEIWDLHEDERVIVEVNAHCLPIGESACKLTRFIGSMVRMPSFAPLSYTSWPLMPAEKKEEMWRIVKVINLVVKLILNFFFLRY